VTKYIGDCVMAHFPPDYADAAIEACLEALDDVRRLRRVAGQCQPMNLLYCGFGLSEGEVIQGNIGSTIKMDYTVLGDTVNLAAQLEALTRTIRRALALSEPVQQSAKGSWPFANVGQFALKRQGELSTVYSLHDPLVTDRRGDAACVRKSDFGLAGQIEPRFAIANSLRLLHTES
jgi:adenylate cyclase